jgi:hypothetical protein
MTVLEATNRALQAAEAGDLEELSRAVQARGAAIAAAPSATPGVRPPGSAAAELLAAEINAGQRLCDAIEDLKRAAFAEHARLRRMREFLPPGGSGLL